MRVRVEVPLVLRPGALRLYVTFASLNSLFWSFIFLQLINRQRRSVVCIFTFSINNKPGYIAVLKGGSEYDLAFSIYREGSVQSCG